MNITRENIDALNAVVKVDIAKEDYSNKVEEILNNYRKTANIPGFRKGHVPYQMVKKQYGKAVLVDEVNKLLQDALNKYLTEEKLDVLGQPLPKPQDNLDWDSDLLSFEFELGLAPEFTVDLKSKKPITNYTIVADDKMIDCNALRSCIMVSMQRVSTAPGKRSAGDLCPWITGIARYSSTQVV